MSDKATNQFLQQLEDKGYTVIRRSHSKVFWKGRLVTVSGNTPSKGRRSLDNMKAQVRRFEREEANASTEQGHRT
jgi:hypothetical protein